MIQKFPYKNYAVISYTCTYIIHDCIHTFILLKCVLSIDQRRARTTYVYIIITIVKVMYDVVHIKCLSTRSALAVSLQEHHGADPTALSKVH